MHPGESFVRGVALVATMMAVLALGGCVRDPFVTDDDETRSGEWYINRQIDRVTGEQLPSATVFADASNSYEDFPKMSSMVLTCFDGHPIVRFAFEFKIGTTRNVVVGYRFDDKPGHENVPARIVATGHQILIIEDKYAVARFVSELRGSRKLYMRMRSLSAGRSSAEYDLEGSEAALQQAYAKCPLPPLPPPTSPGRNS